MARVETEEEYVDLLVRNGERAGDVRQFEAGELVFREGDEGDRMYVVKRGTVSLAKGADEIEKVGPGGLFGEMALLGSRPRSLTATAETESELVSIESGRFWYLVQETPYFAQVVMRVMADRLLRQTGQAAG
ncbi:MAG: cyclic nucleotide-binding domain-containing protein [Gaiellaceae bacterium]